MNPWENEPIWRSVSRIWLSPISSCVWFWQSRFTGHSVSGTGRRIISKGEKERKFLEIKENKSCIFNPMGGKRFPWGSYYGLTVKIHSKMVLKKDYILCMWQLEHRILKLLFTPTPPRGVFTRFLRDQTQAIRIIAWATCAKPLFCGFCACVTGRGVNSNILNENAGRQVLGLL